MSKTQEQLDAMTLDEVRDWRADCFTRHYYKDGKYRKDVDRAACVAESDFLDKYYKQRRLDSGTMSALDMEFLSTVDVVRDRMRVELEAASKALERAIAISEETGIPLEADVSFLGQTYTPDTSKWSEVSEELLEEHELSLTNRWGGEGWEHSDVC